MSATDLDFVEGKATLAGNNKVAPAFVLQILKVNIPKGKVQPLLIILCTERCVTYSN